LKNPSELTIPLPASGTTTAIVYRGGGAALVLGHGAGAGQRSPFMMDFARALAARGVDAVTFNFPYTEQRRRIPDRGPVLEACYRAVVAAVREHVDSAREHLFIGGKSMGGRIATQIAAADPDLAVAGLVLLGYPLHPPGQPEKLRDAHLPSVRRPMLFVQGSRDTFGTPGELEPVLARVTPAPVLHVIEGGDHSFKLGRKDPVRQQEIYTGIQQAIVRWITTGAT